MHTHWETMDVVCLQKQFYNSHVATKPYRCYNDEQITEKEVER